MMRPERRDAIIGGMMTAAGSLENPNFLVLDEPTNHLDTASLEVLEAELRSYPGGYATGD